MHICRECGVGVKADGGHVVSAHRFLIQRLNVLEQVLEVQVAGGAEVNAASRT